MDVLTSKQLDKKADEFVNDYRNASDEEISKIIAGMTAIISENESAYENMKNQRWFERIWYGLTLKHKATVKEMRAKRDQLTKYTLQILVKMNSLMNEHGTCIYDLYRAIAVVRRDLDVVVDEVNELAHKLNEKIISVDNYNMLLNDIRNEKFDVNSPLISLIEIMSLIDSSTAKDTKKLIQIKETMEKSGFDFSKKIDIMSYSNEILALPEDNVGRILLFCQSFSHKSRFLSYTCALMENYFYLWDTEKHIVRENGEAIQSALSCANLNADANCVVGEMFSDLKNAIYMEVDWIEVVADDSNNDDINEKYDNGENYYLIGIKKCEMEEYELAVEYFRLAAELGNQEGQFWLGCCYCWGVGVLEDKTKAKEWFEKSAEQGNGDSIAMLGVIAHDNEEFYDAYKYYKAAADKDSRIGWAGLGQCYFRGIVVDKDIYKARECLVKAYENGWRDEGDIHLIAYIYEIDRKYFEAEKWYNISAELGNVKSMGRLARMYLRGFGIPKDMAKACYWIEEAKRQGYEGDFTSDRWRR